MAVATALRMTPMMKTRVLRLRADASAVRLEGGVQLHATADPVPGHRIARLSAAMQEVLLADLEEQEQHRLELVETAVHEEEVPLEALVAV